MIVCGQRRLIALHLCLCYDAAETFSSSDVAEEHA